MPDEDGPGAIYGITSHLEGQASKIISQKVTSQMYFFYFLKKTQEL